MNTLHKKFSLVFFTITALILLVFLVLPWLGILLTIFSVGLVLAHRLHFSLIQSLIISALLLVGYVGTFEFIASVIFPDSPNFAVIYSTLAIILIIAVSYLVRAKNVAISELLTLKWKDEIPAIIIAGLSTLFFAIPMIHPFDAAVSISFFSAGEDNASHFAMMNYGIENQRAPYLTTNDSGLLEALNVYPQGIHSSFALFYNSAFNTDASIAKKLLVYATSMLFSIFVLIYSMTALCFRLLRESPYRFVVAIVVATSGVLWFISQLVTYGFLSQIFAYALLFCLLLIVQNKHLTSQKNIIYFIPISLLIILGIVFAWYLLAPIAALLVFKPYYRAVTKERSKIAAILITVAVLVSISLVMCNISGAASGTITTPGAVFGFEAWVYWLAFGVIGIYTIYQLASSRSTVTSFDLFVYGSTGLALLIGAYQLVAVGEFRYYYFKFMYLVLLIAFIIIAIFLTLISEARSKKSTLYISLFVVVYLFSYLATVQPGNIRQYLNEEYLRSFQASDIRPILQEDSFPAHNDAVFTGNCPIIYKYMLNRWAGALYLSENEARSRLYGRSFKTPNKFDSIYTSYTQRYDHIATADPDCPR